MIVKREIQNFITRLDFSEMYFIIFIQETLDLVPLTQSYYVLN